jgi:oxygen-independent coproporphyrinogen III oxidase
VKAGIYLHIPFCKSRCSYCDFATDVYKSADAVERYVAALVREIADYRLQITNEHPPIEKLQATADERPTANDRQKPKTENRKPVADTVYFGGGTPSLLTPAQLERILDEIRRNFEVEPAAEITMEMNPATMTLETVRAYRSLGVNRASFGAQTFDDAELKRLGRRHTAADVRETIELLRAAGFDNVSFDLIAGLPRQTLKDWERNLDEALKLAPEHLSLYLLEVHEGAPLAEQIRSRRQPAPDEDLAAEMYELMLEKTAAAGYEQYEISNFSRPGFHSRHNSKYWLCAPVHAFGVSAHSFDGRATRRANERDTNRYVRSIEEGRSPVVEINKLDGKQFSAEFAFLNLRLTKGLDLNDYRARFGLDLASAYELELERLKEFGLIEIDRDFLRLTRRGMVYSNEVFSIFV